MNFYTLLNIVPDFLPQETIDLILDNKSTNFSPALVGWGEGQKQVEDRKTKWLNLPNEINEYLKNFVCNLHDNHLSTIYNSKLSFLEPPQLLRYDIGDHYDLHNDSESYVLGKLKRVVDRDISILLYLNDDYEGGELEFTDLQITIKPKKGMLITFPSYKDYLHKVHPVTKGTRYTIVSWINTEKRLYARPYDCPPDVPRKWVLSS